MFVSHLIDSDGEFSKDLRGIRASMRIDDAMKEGQVVRSIRGELLVLRDDEDYDRLCRAAQQPTVGYPLRPARLCEGFIVAIKDATSEPPGQPAAQPVELEPPSSANAAS
jgi:hypothetical protein